MSTQNSEFTRKLRAAVRAKVEEYGIDVDDELPDYVMIMVGNKKDKNRMKTDLKLFLGENTSDFVEWLFGFFQKVKATPLNASTSTMLPRPEPSTSEAKQKERQPIIEDEHVAANTDQGGKISSKPSQKPKVKPSKFARTTESIRLRKKEKSPGLRSRKIADDKKDEPFPSQTARSTTFAVPRPVLRSVVAVVNSCQSSAHPRIRPRTPSPGVDSTEIAEFSPTSPSPKSMQHQFADYRREEAAPADIPHKRRVLAVAKSLLFQRALPQSSQNLVNFEKNTNEKEVEEEKEHDQLDFVVNEPTENVTITMLGEEEEDGARQPQQQQKAKSSGRQNGSAFPGIAGSLFQRAIQETKKQTEGATHNQHNLSNKKLHTSAEGEEQTSATQKEDEDGPESKKIRIEWESAEAHSGIEEDESVLVINFDKSTSRSIRKGQRKAKSGLTLLKEHIGVGARTASVKEHSEEQLSSSEHGNAKSALEIDEKEEAQPSSDLERNSRIGKMHIKNASSSTASARLWDGRIEIDDLSSTDDEAEIDALLEQQHKLKKMALEREKELKGRELPPTAALTRPLFYQPEVVSQQSVPEQRQPLLSPNETNLLPAIFQPQLAAVQPQFVVTQQQPQLSITRPHATVAPSLSTTSVPTTPATSSISMFLRQNSLQLHTQQQFAHPYSIGNSRHPQMASPQSHNTTASYNYKSKAAHSKMYSPAPAGLVHSGFAGSTTTTTMEKDLAYQTRLFLIKLREQHRQLTQSYANMLEEQRLILAQIQKMASNKNSGEQRKNLLFRCKQMEKNAHQIKAQLESLSRRMAELSKFGGNLTNVV